MKRVIALGFFDGVHLGHGGLLKAARDRADALGCTASVMTFDRHPSLVISGQSEPLISSQRDREYWIKSLYGMDEVLFIHFDHAMMQMPWEQFLDECLLQDLNVIHVVCGSDYRFGYRGQGNAAILKEACAQRGIGCDIIEEISLDGTPIHSTLVRELLQTGSMEEAARFMGHPYSISGRVITGKRLGHTIGIPTANLAVPPDLLPLPRGVYATKVCFDAETHIAVTNVGCCPTVYPSVPLTIEPWILDFSGDLYGKEMRVFFYRMLREERKFPSLEALQQAIHQNAEETRAYFAAQSEPIKV